MLTRPSLFSSLSADLLDDGWVGETDRFVGLHVLPIPEDTEVLMARKARQSESPVTPSDVVVKLRLSAETVQQLRVEALGRRVSLSALVEELFRSVPRRYVLQERSARPSVESSPGPKLVVGPHVAESA